MTAKMKHWQDPLNLALGLWMVASPWVLSYSAEFIPTRNAVIVGLLIAWLALLALFKLMAWEEWVSVAVGVWLAISPRALDFIANRMATWNALIVGIIVAVLALWALGTDRDIGGWWTPAT